MNLALTLVIQGIVFFLVAWGVMTFFWPWLMEKVETRQKTIAEGLAAAKRGQKELDEAHLHATEILREAREKGAHMVELAAKRSTEIVEEAKGTAVTEGQRLIAHAHEEITLETTRAREGLRHEVGKLAIAGASRLLQREIDAPTHAELLDKLSAEISSG
jgi:F-type H+-transporting ATPase subunit b